MMNAKATEQKQDFAGHYTNRQPLRQDRDFGSRGCNVRQG